MKTKYRYQAVLCLFFFFFLHCSAQTDFLSIYQNVKELLARHDRTFSGVNVDKSDPAEVSQWSHYKSEIWDTVLMESTKLRYKIFPDITFKDIEGKDHSISELNKKPLIINYNYYYCLQCIQWIDTTVSYAGNDVNILVLLQDSYHQDLKDLKNYPPNVHLGSISKETAEMISLRLGNDIYYYLNKKGQIEFFRKMSQEGAWDDWRSFLKQKQNE